jgi:hypothetical protein
MEKNLEDLIRNRKTLFSRMETLGDFRWGSISETYRKCGKPNCACADKKHPGHVQYLWTTRKKGKTVAKVLHPGSEMDQFQKQIEEGGRFQKMCDDIWDTSEEICRLRPVLEMKEGEELEELKKKLRRKFFRKHKRKSIV